MNELSTKQLDRVTGGNTGPQVCTPDNPNGTRPTRYWENSPPTSAPGQQGGRR